MKYKIERQGEDILINFEELGGNAEAVIDALGRCSGGGNGCSSRECMKILSMDKCPSEGSLAVRLKPRPDLGLDVASLGECLKFHLPRQTTKQ